jgi:hypothetical protein
MAKVTIKGIPELKKNITETFDKIRKDPELLAQIAVATKDNILGYARSGRNPETKKSFPSLSDSWRAKRDYLSRFNEADGEFYLGTGKSNLTFTGSLLKSLKSKIVPSKSSVIVEATGMHPGYKSGPNGKAKKIKNDVLVGYLKDKGFEFLTVSDDLRKRINVLTKAFVRRLIKKTK